MSRRHGKSESGSTYTDQDIAQFESLMRFNRIPPLGPQSGGTKSAEPAFHYTGQDDSKFQKLMTFDTTKVAAAATARRASYTSTDDALFEQLAPRAGSAGAAAPHASPAPSAPAEPLPYTRKDLAAFRRLLPGDGEHAEPVRPDEPVHRDLDVGPIRIVDADLERERQRRNRDRNPSIKVRFFE